MRRSGSCNIPDTHASVNLDDVERNSNTLPQKNNIEYTMPYSPLLSESSPTPGINSSSNHPPNFLELMADPNYYHTVHGGQKCHVTASRSTKPLAPITRISIGDRSLTQAFQTNVAKAVSTTSGPSNGFGFNMHSLKLVRPFFDGRPKHCVIWEI